MTVEEIFHAEYGRAVSVLVRMLGDIDMAEEAVQALVRACLRRDQPGPYQIQAAINAVHSAAPTTADTDWRQIVALYDQLMVHAPTPVVALNRAVAIAEVDGPAEALALVEALAGDLVRYEPYQVVLTELRRRVAR